MSGYTRWYLAFILATAIGWAMLVYALGVLAGHVFASPKFRRARP